MNNTKRKALSRFRKIKALKEQRRKEAISNFIDDASRDAKQLLLGLQPLRLRPVLFILDDKL